ncbi:MAG TPA: hypothetical protein VL360_03780 [Gammaproteobacteria bacterium]|nr:hypothetical protein [Gammaproteobacteria bacterium]
MRKISLTQDGKTLTLFVADNAFESIHPAYPAETEIAILQMLADRMINKFNASKTIFLAQLLLPDHSKAHDFEAIYIDADDVDRKLRRRKVSKLEITNETLHLLQIPVEDLGDNPPINTDDTNFMTTPAVHRTLDIYKQLAGNDEDLAILLAIEEDNNEPVPMDGETRFPRTVNQLRLIRDEIIGNLPANPTKDISDAIEFLDNKIKFNAGSIDKQRKLAQSIAKSVTNSEYNYYKIIDSLTIKVYNAAKDYYIQIWKENKGNLTELPNKRDEFNQLFAGIVKINPDFSLSNIEDSIKEMREISLEEAEKLISNLMDNAYKYAKKAPPSTILLGRLDGSEYFKPVSKPTTYGFAFSETSRQAYDVYVRERQALEDGMKSSTVKNSVADVKDYLEDIIKRANSIRADFLKNVEPKVPSFWQRNKATIISIGLGVLIGGAAAAAFVLFAPVTLPLLAMIGIAAAGALAVVGISAIIGRVIDKGRNAKAKQEMDFPATAEERKSLLTDETPRKPSTTSLTQLMNGSSTPKKLSARSESTIEPTATDQVTRKPSSPTLFQRVSNSPDLMNESAIEAKASFEVAFAYKVAELLDQTMGDTYFKVTSTFSESGYDINKFIPYLIEEYPASAKGVIKSAIRQVAENYPNLNPDLFNGSSLSNPAYELKNAITAAGKKEDTSSSKIRKKDK